MDRQFLLVYLVVMGGALIAIECAIFTFRYFFDRKRLMSWIYNEYVTMVTLIKFDTISREHPNH